VSNPYTYSGFGCSSICFEHSLPFDYTTKEKLLLGHAKRDFGIFRRRRSEVVLLALDETVANAWLRHDGSPWFPERGDITLEGARTDFGMSGKVFRGCKLARLKLHA
jgi:hypothetical protein